MSLLSQDSFKLLKRKIYWILNYNNHSYMHYANHLNIRCFTNWILNKLKDKSTQQSNSDIRLATTGTDRSVISTGSAVVSIETGSSVVSIVIWTSLVDALSTEKKQQCVCVSQLMQLSMWHSYLQHLSDHGQTVKSGNVQRTMHNYRLQELLSACTLQLSCLR